MTREGDMEWRDIAGFEGLYSVSSAGDVKSIARISERGGNALKINEKILKAGACKGYRRVSLRKGRKTTYRMVHQLVAEAFIGPRKNGDDTRHLDGNSMNNRVENIAYGTRSENIADAIRTKGIKTGHRSPNAKLSREQVEEALKSDDTSQELAAKFGVSAGQIRAIRKGFAWKHEVMERRDSYRRIGEKQSNAKMTEEKVKEVLESRESIRRLAKKFGVDKSIITRIRKGDAWKCVRRS